MKSCFERILCGTGETVTVIRQTKGNHDKGRWVEGSISSFEIQASVQVADGKDLIRVEEGRRVHESIKIYSTSLLKTASKEEQTQPDEIVWRGKNFLIEQVDDWSSQGGYYKAIGIKKE